jgi:hypothetical protein
MFGQSAADGADTTIAARQAAENAAAGRAQRLIAIPPVSRVLLDPGWDSNLGRAAPAIINNSLTIA